MIPGRVLRRLAGMLCSRDMCERVIDAFFADFQRECLDAATWRRRVTVVGRGYAWFVLTFAGCLVHDAQHDSAGFTTRALKGIAFAGVALASVVAPSWVKTGRIDWIDVAQGIGLMGSLAAAFLIAGYRSRNADRRSLPAFGAGLAVALAMLMFHPPNAGPNSVYEWVYMVSLTMAWPFLIRRQPDPGQAKVASRSPRSLRSPRSPRSPSLLVVEPPHRD